MRPLLPQDEGADEDDGGEDEEGEGEEEGGAPGAPAAAGWAGWAGWLPGPRLCRATALCLKLPAWRVCAALR